MNFWNSFKATYVHGWIFVLRWNVTSELRLLTGYLIEDWNPFYIWRKNCVGQRARVALKTKKDDWVCKTIDVAFDKSKSVEVEVEVAYLLDWEGKRFAKRLTLRGGEKTLPGRICLLLERKSFAGQKRCLEDTRLWLSQDPVKSIFHRKEMLLCKFDFDFCLVIFASRSNVVCSFDPIIKSHLWWSVK